MSNTQRTDCHRPGAIVPEDYRPVVWYSLATSEGGWPVPAINIDKVIEVHKAAREAGKAVFGSTGKCGVCGAVFVYGEVWRHEPTGELVHLGHDCSTKYELIQDVSVSGEYLQQNEVARRATAAERIRAQKALAKQRYLDEHPGLEEALKVDHHIVADLADKLARFGSLSDKQIALAKKLADEVKNPKPAEVHVPGPLGKTEFTGEIVGAKTVVGDYGTAVKITVKVQATGGTWLAWGTAPKALLDACGHASGGNDALRGKVVTLRGTLEAGRDEHFRFVKRPSLVKVT